MLRFSIPTHTGYNRKSSLTCCTVGVASPISSNMFLNMVLSCLQAARLRSTPVRTPPFSTTAAVFSSGGWPCVPVDYEPARVSRCRHTSAGEAAPCGRADEIKHTTRSQSTLEPLHCAVARRREWEAPQCGSGTSPASPTVLSAWGGKSVMDLFDLSQSAQKWFHRRTRHSTSATKLRRGPPTQATVNSKTKSGGEFQFQFPQGARQATSHFFRRTYLDRLCLPREASAQPPKKLLYQKENCCAQH